MEQGPITDQELAEVLRRAAEIDAQTQVLLDPSRGLEQIVSAAEEAGLSRDSTVQALRERLGVSVADVGPGEFVFAKSADGAFHVATVELAEGPRIQVRFVSGSLHTCGFEDLRPFSLTPGQRVQVFSSGFWWDGAVQRVNTEARSATVSVWGDPQVVSYDQMRLKPEHSGVRWAGMRPGAIAVASALAGGALGALLTFLLNR